MNRRKTGVILCFISSMLFSVKYISASIFGIGAISIVKTWNSALYQSFLDYTGKGLNYAVVICLLGGIFYLVFAEIKRE